MSHVLKDSSDFRKRLGSRYPPRKSKGANQAINSRAKTESSPRSESEKLVDLEDYFRRWRFNHVTTVERVIGFKRGTGGTGGVSYLRRMLEVELFPELWHLRTAL